MSLRCCNKRPYYLADGPLLFVAASPPLMSLHVHSYSLHAQRGSSTIQLITIDYVFLNIILYYTSLIIVLGRDQHHMSILSNNA